MWMPNVAPATLSYYSHLNARTASTKLMPAQAARPRMDAPWMKRVSPPAEEMAKPKGALPINRPERLRSLHPQGAQ